MGLEPTRLSAIRSPRGPGVTLALARRRAPVMAPAGRGIHLRTASLLTAASSAMRLLAQHGREYRTQYGWAAAAIPPEDRTSRNAVTFADLAKAVEGEGVCQYVTLAHFPTHAGASASYWDAGRPPEWPRAPSGPTNIGLSLAGHATAPALALATSAFLYVHRDIESVVDVAALTILAGECRDLFERDRVRARRSRRASGRS